MEGLAVTPLAGEAGPASGGQGGAAAVRSSAAAGEASNGTKVIHRLQVAP